MKLEVVVVPVSDVDRAQNFYKMLGWPAGPARSLQVCPSQRTCRQARLRKPFGGRDAKMP
jgi:hypothetical protein